METANGQIRETGKRAQQAANEVKKNAIAQSDEAVSYFEDIASTVQEAVSTSLSKFGDNAMAYRSTAETSMKKNPMSWVLGAAAVGLGLGLIYSFTRPSKR